ncbi:MAG: gliding motility protein GldL [Paludibacteraceae bacterium]|jgi:gliding motility-associated protein GldL|nr:gliding motility protein GldL [Paludibacteraceae bacterium]MBP5482525.1 gliding motility protein GldL [Paludibacteraceae bacterium]
MSFSELRDTAGYQKFTALAYGLGASVVIIGALFKIMHWPGAGIVLTIGMCTEAFLFALSAFDKPHIEYKWDRVYPQLHEDEEGAVGTGVMNTNAANAAEEKRLELQKIREMVDGEMQNLKDGIHSLNVTAGQLTDLSSAAAVSGEYTNTLRQATSAASAFASSQQSLKEASESLDSSYKSIASSISSASQGSQNFAAQIDGINKNISTINSVFELQVKSVNEQNEAMKTLASAVKTIETSLNGSAAEAEEYKKQVALLASQMKSLNSIYGGMLSAMTIK